MKRNGEKIMGRKKKNKYHGYKRPVPENMEIREIQKKNAYDGGIYDYEKRYVIIDADTGEVFG